MNMRIVFICILLSLVRAPALATTWHVPGDVSTIQAAIDSAADTDVILVAPGTYNERLTIDSKELTLSGSGALLTTVDGGVAAGSVITVRDVNRSTILSDLTITGGSIDFSVGGGSGVELEQADPIIARCRVVQNTAARGGGIRGRDSDPLVVDSWVAYNGGGGVSFDASGNGSAEIINTFIVRNSGFGLECVRGARVAMIRSTVAFNSGDGVRGERGPSTTSDTDVVVNNSIVTNNDGAGIIRYDVDVCFHLQCNNVFANMNGNWVGTNPADPCFTGRGAGSVAVDPRFRDAANDDFTLAMDSPLFFLCAPNGCGPVGAENYCNETFSLESDTWGGVKLRYRGAVSGR